MLLRDDPAALKEAERVGAELFTAVAEINPANYYSDIGMYSMTPARRREATAFQEKALERVRSLRREYLRLFARPYLQLERAAAGL